MSETQTPEPQTSDMTEQAGSYAGDTLGHGQTVTDQQSTRAFYRSDYGRAARLIQAARHVPGDIYTAKSDAQLDSVTALAFTLVQTFEADSDHFDAGEFMDATQLPARPEPAIGSMLHTLTADDDADGYMENEGEAEMAALDSFTDPE